MHTEFYACANYSRQRDFILQSVCSRQTNSGKRKSQHNQFSVIHDGVRTQVCKQFFLKTLDNSDNIVTYTLQHKRSPTNQPFSAADGRGRHEPSNKTDNSKLAGVREHINSFPRMNAHYTRADSNRQFLGTDLNISRMYHLYKETCGATGVQPVKLGVYRRVFCTEFNLFFHQPRKDVCSKCESYAIADNEEKEALEAQHKEHLERKELARNEKAADKAKACKDSTYHAVTVDLQSVLTTPCSNVYDMYYSRKLAVYNFTVFNQATADGWCMMWNETNGQRGANEIGSLLFYYLRDCVPSSAVHHVVITSDSTVSQNRNRFVAGMMLVAVNCLPHISIIEQKFLEPGHTEMEVDAMHAAIDFSKRNIKVFALCEWPMLLQTARRSKPYAVKEFDFSDFYDLHELLNSLGTHDLKKRVHWISVKCIRVKKGACNEIEVKESYSDEYKRVTFCPTRGRNTRRHAEV